MEEGEWLVWRVVLLDATRRTRGREKPDLLHTSFFTGRSLEGYHIHCFASARTARHSRTPLPAKLLAQVPGSFCSLCPCGAPLVAVAIDKGSDWTETRKKEAQFCDRTSTTRPVIRSINRMEKDLRADS